jgi:DNA (cytosine-5)-methyltransferase 1
MRPVPTEPIRNKLIRLLRGGRPRIVDLFSGCGGMSLGFQAAGYEILAGIELEDVRARTHATNFHKGKDEALHGKGRDITAHRPQTFLRQLLGDGSAPVDIIVGGPPCQAYARVGRAKLREIAQHAEAHLHDPRGSLYAAYLGWVAATQPVAFVMENVPDILRFGGVNVGEIIAQSLDQLGYEVRYTLLNAANFGVPQTRERWYLLGIHKAAGLQPRFPNPTHQFELPVGYRGTRAEASRWDRIPDIDRPKHAEVLRAAYMGLPEAVNCEEAIGDLPLIITCSKLIQKRRARNLADRMPYRNDPSCGYQRLMREWTGYRAKDDVSAHVIRSLPRDYGTFARMPEGADYPQARKIAEEIFHEKLAEERQRGRVVREGSRAWDELWKAIVPPYDVSKFPNKWRKLERRFPSRTLMAHLSHDSYSHIHYDSRQARTISVREAARLQSFPDGFEFCGAMNAAFGQIGNAVPPLMAKAIAIALRNSLRVSDRAQEPAAVVG